jgi:hypothetical protein
MSQAAPTAPDPDQGRGGRSRGTDAGASTLWWVALALALAVLAVAGWRLQALLIPAAAEVAAPDPGCSLRDGPCRLALPKGGSVTLEIAPRAIPVVTPLDLRVAVEGRGVTHAEIDFAGVDMNMGYNRVALEPAGGGRFEGRGMLPVCVRERMTWEARVLLETPEGLVAAPFRFDTLR